MEEFKIILEQTGTLWDNPSLLLVLGALVSAIPTIIMRLIDNSHTKRMLELQYSKDNIDLIWQKKEDAYITIMNFIDEHRTSVTNGTENSEEYNNRIKEIYLSKFSKFNLYVCKEVDDIIDTTPRLYTMPLEEYEPIKKNIYGLMRKDLGIDQEK